VAFYAEYTLKTISKIYKKIIDAQAYTNEILNSKNHPIKARN